MYEHQFHFPLWTSTKIVQLLQRFIEGILIQPNTSHNLQRNNDNQYQNRQHENRHQQQQQPCDRLQDHSRRGSGRRKRGPQPVVNETGCVL